jgi:hypothetical protein
LGVFLTRAILRRLGLVAQLVEQRIENPCVGGSIPPRATKFSKQKRQPSPVGVFVFCPPFPPLRSTVVFLLIALYVKAMNNSIF